MDVVGALSYGAYGVGRLLGSRASKPECGSDPPSWVQDILVVEDPNAEVFACGESEYVDELRDDLLLRIVSNRGYPIVLTAEQLFGDEPRVEYDVIERSFLPDVTDAILRLLRPVLAEDDQIFLTGTETVELRFFKESLRPILYLKFESDASGVGLVVDIFISVVLAILSHVGGSAVENVIRFGTRIVDGWNCLSQVLNERSARGANVVSLIEAYVTASCFDVWLGQLQDQVERDLKAGFGNGLKGLKRVLVVATVAKIAADITLKLGDFFVLGSALSGAAPVTLTGRFTIRSPYVDPSPRPLGEWRPTCSFTAADQSPHDLSASSKQLYINLAAREKYSGMPRYYLHEIAGWDSDAATAVTALTNCGAEAMAEVAEYIQQDPENYWTEPRSAEIVADKIYQTFGELGFGDWTAACDNTAADIAAMRTNLTAHSPFSRSSPPYSRFQSFRHALAASAAPLKQCGPDYVIELHERLSSSPSWTGSDATIVEEAVFDLLLSLPIVLPDANLDRAVREHFDVADDEDVTVGDARSATSLNISNSEVMDLDGLHYFINLGWLNASNNRISTFAPILTIAHLSNINLSHNRITDFSELSGNDTITSLNISNNLATSLALDKMTSLTSLDASNNQITNVALTELQSLTSVRDLTSSNALNLANNPITDMKLGGLRRLSNITLDDFPHLKSVELIAMPNLTSLTLNNTSLAHIRLDAHQSLSSINLRNNQLTEVQLSRLPVLSYVDLSSNLLSELELVDFPVLSSVNVLSNRLERLVVRGLGAVTSVGAASGGCNVCISSNPLVELTVMNLPNLASINLSGTGIDTLQTITLSDLPKLSYLHIRGNKIDTLKLVGFDRLATVSVPYNKLTDVELSRLPALSYVDLSNNLLSELELVDFPVLSYVDLSNNLLSELELVDFPVLSSVNVLSNRLERLVVRGLGAVTSVGAASGGCNVCISSNPLVELTVMNLPNLASINLSGTGIDTLQTITLSDLPKLSYLHIRGNKIDTLKLVGFDRLATVSVPYNKLTDVELSRLPALSYVDLSNNLLSELELVDFPVLSYVDLSSNLLSELELVDFPVLSSVNVLSNRLERLVVRGLGAVTSVGAASGGCNVCISSNPLVELTVMNLPNLASINLSGTGIDTLQTITLSDLPKLSYLHIRGNKIDTLKLVGFDRLATVSVPYNKLTDVELSRLPALSYVDLSNNLLSELELVDFPVLSYVDLSSNLLSELELVDFPVLSSVNVLSNRLERLVVRGLGAVTSVGAASGGCNVCISSNPLVELTVMNLPNLASINLSGTGIDTLQTITLSDLPKLSYLHIRGNKIDTLKLVGFDRLATVSVPYNKLTDVELSRLPALSYVDLSNNLLSELELVDFPVLSYVDLSNNLLSELELVDFPVLSSVNVLSNRLERLVVRGLGAVTSVGAASGGCNVCISSNPLVELTVMNLPNLASINLSGTGIDTLQTITLSDLPKLSYLHIRGNKIDTLRISRLPLLATLSASRNNIVDVGDIGSIISLVTLDLDSNDIEDVSPLASLVNLRTLRIASNLVSDFSPLDVLEDLVVHGKDSQRDPVSSG